MTTNNYDYSTEFRNAIRTAIQPWVEWKHIPMGIIHCPTCLKLDKCWFVKTNMPSFLNTKNAIAQQLQSRLEPFKAKLKHQVPFKSLRSIFSIRITLKMAARQNCLSYGGMIRRTANGWLQKVNSKHEKNILLETILLEGWMRMDNESIFK